MKPTSDGSLVDADIEVRAGCHAICSDIREAVKRMGVAVGDAGDALALKVHDAERLVRRTRNNIEDGISEATHELRRHPFRSPSIALPPE
jgi:hypothetical protein